MSSETLSGIQRVRGEAATFPCRTPKVVDHGGQTPGRSCNRHFERGGGLRKHVGGRGWQGWSRVEKR